MTLLISVTAPNFVLSLADRRTVVMTRSGMKVHDDRFNKHVHFGAEAFAGQASFTGVAEFKSKSRGSRTTDQLIGDALARAVSSDAQVVEAVAAVAEDLDQAISALPTGSPRDVAVSFVGFSRLFREPWLIFLTNGPQPEVVGTPQIHEEFRVGQEFRISLWISEAPLVLVAGYIKACSPECGHRLHRLASLQGVDGADVAKLGVREIRSASRRSRAVGDRVSGIIQPADGWADTGLWDRPAEEPRIAMPRAVHRNGTQWEPSEPVLTIDDGSIGRPQRHSLLLHGLIDGRIPKRMARHLRRGVGRLPDMPTIYQLMAWTFFGEKTW